jgi:AAA domain/Bifunctional DNA primase/polymerase, N-terminal/Primase C terminal 1 (PriCT-1)
MPRTQTEPTSPGDTAAKRIARLAAALARAADGFLIGQCYGVTSTGGCLCGRADCKAPGKHGGKGWKEQATRDPDTIRTRFAAGDPNFMAIPPKGSGLLIVDEDVPGMLATLGNLPTTMIVQTSEKPGGERGRHVYGRLPDGINEAELPYQWEGGEIRFGGNGGVVGPLSRHHSGATYEPLNGFAVEMLPDPWVRNLIASGRKRASEQDAARSPSDLDWTVPEPGRHPWLTSMAGRLRRDGLRGDVFRTGLRYLNAARCSPPLPEAEVEEIAAWADKREGDTGPGGTVRPEPRPVPRNVGTSVASPEVDAWLIENVLRPGAILVIASLEGLGKSHVRKEMAVRLTTCGGSLFGYYPIPRTCSVLEIDEENGAQEEIRREEQVFAALSARRADANGTYWSVSFPAVELGDEASQMYLREHVAAHRPGVLMLDTGTSMVDEEWGPELKAAMRFLRRLTVEFGCAVVIFVHLVKPPRGRDATTRLHGSTLSDVMGQWTRTVDAVALLADLGGGRANWRMFKKVPKSELVIAQAEGIWKVVHVGAERKVTNDDRVLRAIAEGGENPDAIAASLGLGTRTVSDAIKHLRNRGLIGPKYPYEMTPAGYEAVA